MTFKRKSRKSRKNKLSKRRKSRSNRRKSRRSFGKVDASVLKFVGDNVIWDDSSDLTWKEFLTKNKLSLFPEPNHYPKNPKDQIELQNSIMLLYKTFPRPDDAKYKTALHFLKQQVNVTPVTNLLDKKLPGSPTFIIGGNATPGVPYGTPVGGLTNSPKKTDAGHDAAEKLSAIAKDLFNAPYR